MKCCASVPCNYPLSLYESFVEIEHSIHTYTPYHHSVALNTLTSNLSSKFATNTFRMQLQANDGDEQQYVMFIAAFHHYKKNPPGVVIYAYARMYIYSVI